MSKVRLHPDVVAIKRTGPKWAVFFVVTYGGVAWWAEKVSPGPTWGMDSGRESLFDIYADRKGASMCAIDLNSGDVYLQNPVWKMVIVPQPQWVAARKRKSRK